MIFAPWMWLAFAAALLASGAGGFGAAWNWQGSRLDAAESRHQAAFDRQKKEAAQTLLAATRAAREKEIAHERDRDTVEKNLALASAKNRALAHDLRLLAAQSGGLRDPGRRPGGDCAVPTAAAAATVDPGAAAAGAGTLSKELERYIFDTAEQADDVLAYAWACHEWAKKVGGGQN